MKLVSFSSCIYNTAVATPVFFLHLQHGCGLHQFYSCIYNTAVVHSSFILDIYNTAVVYTGFIPDINNTAVVYTRCKPRYNNYTKQKASKEQRARIVGTHLRPKGCLVPVQTACRETPENHPIQYTLCILARISRSRASRIRAHKELSGRQRH